MVRELGPLATLSVAISIVGVGTASNLMQVWQAQIYPGSEAFIGLSVALVPSIFFGIMYVLFSMNMPRSGGDYVYTSRIIHPVIGFMMNFVFTFWLVMWWGSNFAIITSASISPALGGFALATNNSGLLSLASSIATTPNLIFLGGAVGLVIVTVFVSLGTRFTARFLVLAFIVGMIGQITMMLIYAGSNQTAFVSAFNSHFAGTTSVTAIEQAATTNGWTFAPFAIGASLAAIPYSFLWYLGYNYSAYVAGEVKNVRSSMFVAILGALGIGWAFYSVTWLLYNNVVPYQFQQSISYLFAAAPSAYPLPIFPGPYFFVGLLNSNPIIALLPSIGLLFWAYNLPVAIAMVVTRNIFAWSFDRVVPRFLSDINPRTHSPIKTMLLLAAIGIVFLYFWVYTSVFALMTNFILGISLACIIPGIAAIVYPYLRKEQWANTPAARYKIGSLPLIVLCGAVSIVFFAYIAYACYVTPGISGPTGVPAMSLILASFVITPIIYYVARWYHLRHEGIDISTAFKEIPPG